MRCSAYSRRFSSAICSSEPASCTRLVAPVDQAGGQRGRAQAEQHPDDRDEPGQALRRRCRPSGRRGVTTNVNALSPNGITIDACRPVIGSFFRSVTSRFAPLCDPAEIQRVVEIGERRVALEFRPAVGRQRALGVGDVAAGEPGRGERVAQSGRAATSAGRSRSISPARAARANKLGRPARRRGQQPARADHGERLTPRPRRQSDTDTNWARPRGPTDGAMKP